ncbi:MAG: hypothetical protein JSV88_06730 [Candidatus Aminicenantes bacterium]|nr:MAG: hypothetical protein JSV88_06730 [Candidatus Aminicenantes bacterium]
MKLKDNSLFARLESVKTTVVNAQGHPRIREALLKYGYKENRFKHGDNLYKAAYKLYEYQKEKYLEQLQATEVFQKTRSGAKKSYMANVKIARVALREDISAVEKLELPGIRKVDFSLWLVQAKSFYNGALETPAILEKLKTYGLTRERLKAGLALVKKAETARERRERARADARKATKERNKAIRKAEMWRSDLIAIARVALTEINSIQLMEALGVTIPS